LIRVFENGKKETVFRNANEVEDIVCNFWIEATFGEVQLVFHKWTRRLEWVGKYKGEYVPE
jgi:hypothetical protein